MQASVTGMAITPSSSTNPNISSGSLVGEGGNQPQPQPHHPQHHLHPTTEAAIAKTVIYSSSQNSPNTNITPPQFIYPVASSGRGFIQSQRAVIRPQDQRLLPMASHTHHQPPNPNRHTSFPNPHHYAVTSPLPKPHLQVAASTSPSPVSNSNGHRYARSGDNAVITVTDRKVRISDGASLYALCRSWLRNGFLKENQPHNGDGAKCLARPLPISVVESHSPKKREREEEKAKEDEEGTNDNLSTKDLLKKHVEHAKRVRARLREERLKRIARYTTRLALLLPQHAEQLKSDAATGN
ncbi:hypothetical protein K2173_007546 [Erythroxylum novogranatense]|uniref:Uncharacterized protein n=1 Tax=Erythroxylum novogranatense TaxID=1862640 RepID=A0AAV8S5V7_9ROSI|nr:hypothetical protein K2173_007546 [Erythroxylum novogranatense]